MEEHLYKTFHDVESHHWWMVARREIILSLLDRWLRPHAKIIDLGCGTGAFLDAAKPRFEVHGLDISPLAVNYCRERGLAEVTVGSITDLSRFDGKDFDGVLLLDVIEHLDDDLGALRNARALLGDGGRLIVTVPAFMFFWSEHDEINRHKRRYTAAELRRTLVDAGYRVEKLSYYNSWLFPVAVAVTLSRRLFRRKASEYDYSPGPVNSLLRGIFSSEKWILGRLNFPVGVSLLAVARPAGDPAPPAAAAGPAGDHGAVR